MSIKIILVCYILFAGHYLGISQISDGEQITFYDNGQVKEKKFYRNQKLDGRWISYFENGNMRDSGYYRDGVKEGFWVSYFKNGNRRLNVFFDRNEKYNNKYTEYDSLGNLLKTGNYKRGRENGLFIEYNDGLIKNKIFYINGKDSGYYFTPSENTYENMKDIDGNNYRVIDVVHKGDQNYILRSLWMIDNLNVSHFRNGDLIPQAKTSEEWRKAGEMMKPAWCYYNNDSSNADKYGKLYNWYAVTDKRGLAPEGWEIPSNNNFRDLENYGLLFNKDDLYYVKIEYSSDAEHLKYFNGWYQNGNGTNILGFEALPGGFRFEDGGFSKIGEYGLWWHTDQLYFILSYNENRYYPFDFNGPSHSSTLDKSAGLSVRCFKKADTINLFKPKDVKQINYELKKIRVNTPGYPLVDGNSIGGFNTIFDISFPTAGQFQITEADADIIDDKGTCGRRGIKYKAGTDEWWACLRKGLMHAKNKDNSGDAIPFDEKERFYTYKGIKIWEYQIKYYEALDKKEFVDFKIISFYIDDVAYILKYYTLNNRISEKIKNDFIQFDLIY